MSGESASSAWRYFSRSPRSSGTSSGGGGTKAALPAECTEVDRSRRRLLGRRRYEGRIAGAGAPPPVLAAPNPTGPLVGSAPTAPEPTGRPRQEAPRGRRPPPGPRLGRARLE